jgi:hypothetical protein
MQTPPTAGPTADTSSLNVLTFKRFHKVVSGVA